MHSCIYEGRVSHRRMAPRPHSFQYRIGLVLLDLDEIDTAFRGRWLWSTRRPALAWFRRADHFGDPAEPLIDSVRNLVDERLGQRPTGPVRLLAHWRYFGYVINPVSFFYCFDASGTRLEAIVAEVQNTPWGQRHCYVLDARDQPAAGVLSFSHSKEFHVSPFLGMDMQYAWRVTPPGEQLAVDIETYAGGSKVLEAQLILRRRALSGLALARLLVAYPLMTARVWAAIYWQALRLWAKRTPFHPHPKTMEQAATCR